jgi:alkanesulfonate monooxygenase SsuD/methylene tetrahydromethanopterin reductase-like flavin-dependent oxidoreductase (luciferase family)
MQLGLFLMPLHPPEKDRTCCFEEDIEQVVLADELGFCEAWVGQHHSVAWEPIPASDLFIAHVLPRTRQIRLGTGVSVMPQHHPANIATRLAYLDHLAHGRLNCGFGQGGVPTDWALFDLPEPKTQGLMTVEAIDMVLNLWQTDPPFDFQGKFWHIKVEKCVPQLGVGTLLKPFQRPHPPIAMSVIKGNSMAARMAGQRGYIPLSSNIVPATTLAQHWRVYCEGAAEAGQPLPNRSIWRVARNIFVGASTAEAWDFACHSAFARSWEYLVYMLKSMGNFSLMRPDSSVPYEQMTVEYLMKQLCIIGDVDECIHQLQTLWETTGGFGTLLMIAHDWDDRAQWMRSMELLARKVVPAMPTL